MQLQRSLGDIKAQGLGLAAISYDSPEILKAFAEKHAITFPMLSDTGSKTITAWGLLNEDATGRTAGIPHPGTYVIDPRGVIRSRDFEEAYQERDTAASIMARLAPATSLAGATGVEGPHITVKLGATDAIAAPGHRITLMLDIMPGPKIHVCAPDQPNYIPISIGLDRSADYKAADPVYPASTSFVFAPLHETVHVYDKPFRVTEDVTLALTPAMRQRATAGEILKISGRVEYQACDDRVCFPPQTLPVSWSIKLAPIER